MANITYASSVTHTPSNSNLLYTPFVLVAVSSFLVLAGASYALRGFESKSQIPALGGFSIVNGWNFFTRRCDFLQSNFKKMGQPIFSFKVLQVSPPV